MIQHLWWTQIQLGSVRTTYTVFTIPNVGVSNAGQYQCRAAVSTTQNNIIDSSPGVASSPGQNFSRVAIANIIVQSKQFKLHIISV